MKGPIKRNQLTTAEGRTTYPLQILFIINCRINLTQSTKALYCTVFFFYLEILRRRTKAKESKMLLTHYVVRLREFVSRSSIHISRSLHILPNIALLAKATRDCSSYKPETSSCCFKSQPALRILGLFRNFRLSVYFIRLTVFPIFQWNSISVLQRTRRISRVRANPAYGAT